MEDHTYFVGEHGVLVHNACNLKDPTDEISEAKKVFMTGKAAEKELAELVGGESQVYKVTSMGGGDLSIS